MKNKRHIQSFNEHQENLNISDVRSSEKKYMLIEEDPQFRKPGGGLFSPPSLPSLLG